MFDIDGTLIESYALDSQCFIRAVKEITGLTIDADWSKYQHVTDSGILDEFLLSTIPSSREAYKTQIKKQFFHHLKASLADHPVKEVSGANAFLKLLQSMNNVAVSIATGGWRESAILKLESAGIDYSSIPMASADDHYARVEIMKLAAARASKNQLPCTYFGDAVWDKEACKRLGYHFVLVGKRFSHDPCISDFESVQSALSCAGLPFIDKVTHTIST